MLEKINKQIDQVKEQIALRDELQSKAAEGKETLSQGAYRLDTIEIQLEMLVEEIRKLEQFGLSSLMASLSGGRAEKLDAKQAEYEALEQDYREYSETIASFEEELPKIEAQLADFGDLDADLQSLYHEKNRLLAESGDDSGLQLEQLSETLAKAQDNAKKTERAVDEGQDLLSSLEITHGTTRSVRKGYGQLLYNNPNNGALLNTAISIAYDKYKEKLANKLTSPAYDSLARFHDAIFDLDLSDDTPENKEIRDALPAIDLQRKAQLDANDDTWIEIQSLVSNVLIDLKKKLRCDQETAKALEQEYQQMLENA